MKNSLLKKRLPGILAAGLVALAVGAVGATPAAASDTGASALNAKISISKSASTSALTRAQRRARIRHLRVCVRRSRNFRQRRRCVRRIKRHYIRLSRKQQKPRGKTHRVMLLDPYSYSPNRLNIKVNDSILWDWRRVSGREPHDVTPVNVPRGVRRNDFKSALSASPKYRFKRQFTKPGRYSFVCSIHYQMTMTVNVRR